MARALPGYIIERTEQIAQQSSEIAYLFIMSDFRTLPSNRLSSFYYIVDYYIVDCIIEHIGVLCNTLV